MRESHLQRMPSVLYSIVLWQSLQVWLGREWLDVGGCSYQVLGNKPPCSFTCTKPSQLVKLLVFSFVSCASRHPSPIVEDAYEKPHWLRAYHAYLQWQLVYFDLLNLNQLLMEPFESKSPSLLFNGPMVLYYATHESPDLLDTMIYKMNHENRKLFKKLFTAILPQ